MVEGVGNAGRIEGWVWMVGIVGDILALAIDKVMEKD